MNITVLSEVQVPRHLRENDSTWSHDKKLQLQFLQNFNTKKQHPRLAQTKAPLVQTLH